MRFSRLACLLLAGIPADLLAANKEHEAIQRDVGLLSEDVRKLQRLMEDQALQLKTMVQQAITTSANSNTSVVGLEVKVIERLQTFDREIKSTVAGLGAKVDSMADEFRRVKEDVADLNGRLGRMQNEMADVKNACTTIKVAPPPAEPPQTPQGSGQAGSAGAPGPPPGVNAQSLLDSAERDRIAGRNDLAQKQYEDFLKWFPATESACVAQFRIGEVHMAKQDLVNALVAFDNVLERYGDDCRYRAAAQFMKGRGFEKGGQRSQAAKEYRKVIEDYPSSDWATRARSALRELGMNVTAPTTSQKKRTR
jgi:TolA-binding protein